MTVKKLPWLLLLLLMPLSVRGGTIAPSLEILLQNLGQDESIKVLVVLEDQADIPGLDRNLRGAKAAMSQRHRLVVESLREAAARSQSGLVADLRAKSKVGRVVGFVPHWLINSIVVTATGETIRGIAARPDVARVEPDLVPVLISPVPGIKTIPAFADSGGIGTAPGIRLVGAPRVWSEYGIDGSGRIVGIMDTGVDGTHPALAARWRGNFAPAEECWLDAVGSGDTAFPVDRNSVGHGTHVMGTLTGLAPGDTIGVAPGARWIAANTILGNLGLLDNAVLASLEFMTDPDGDPSTTGDMPDVVHSSWGVFEAFDGYFDCDSRWWEAIDNIEAAGVVLTWAAGNEGPNFRSVRSPADRATSPYNCFSVGATEISDPSLIADFSSRGPSGCGGSYEIKPEVVAPGRDIYSARPGGLYQLLSGTSMAGPHVAGVVALMRQANPDLDVVSIKEILMATAIDGGDPGQDNIHGHGFIDAYAAVTAALTNIGTMTGTVSDQITGAPLADARITRYGGFNTTLTDDQGNFSLTMLAGRFDFLVSRFGYYTNGIAARIAPDSVATYHVALYPKPTAVISGLVSGPDGGPVAGAWVTPLDIPVDPVETDADGHYELELPKGTGVIYNLQGKAAGLGYVYHAVELVGDLVRDFDLPEQFVEDFETADFRSYPWTGSGNSAWTIDSVTRQQGKFSARSGAIRNDQSSNLSLNYYVSGDSYIQFWTRTSTEYFYDRLVFYLDGVPVAAWSGEKDWSQFRMLVPRGHHNFKWAYERDVAYAEGQDTVWLDFIEFPTTGEELFPSVSVDLSSLSATVAKGDTLDVPFIISNTGDWILDFEISIGDLLKNKAPAPGGAPRFQPKINSGGPDAFGYQWRDSDGLDGPVYEWVDITADGLIAGTGNDEMLGPFPLGFNFSFYESTYDSVRVCTNGFLSFTSLYPASDNVGIPEPYAPNNILAAFWDDLSDDAGGLIYYKSEPENDRFIVQFEQMARRATRAPESFQIILNGDGSILYQYDDVQETGHCTVGIENPAGDDGLLALIDRDNYLHDGMAILFEPPFIMARVAPAGGQIVPGSSLGASVTFDATNLEPGFHVAVMTIKSTDPVVPELLVPLMLTVTAVSGTPDVVPLRKVAFTGAVPNPFNPATSLKFSLPADARVELDIFDVSGRRVRSLVAGRLAAGPHSVPWKGRDDADRNVASGSYFARLTVDGVSSVKSVTLVR